MGGLLHLVQRGGAWTSASPVMSRFTSLFSCQPIFVIIITVIIHHFFTLSLQAQNLPFQQILPTLIDFWYPLDCFNRSWDWTGHIVLVPPGLLQQIMGLDWTGHIVLVGLF